MAVTFENLELRRRGCAGAGGGGTEEGVVNVEGMAIFRKKKALRFFFRKIYSISCCQILLVWWNTEYVNLETQGLILGFESE